MSNVRRYCSSDEVVFEVVLFYSIIKGKNLAKLEGKSGGEYVLGEHMFNYASIYKGTIFF